MTRPVRIIGASLMIATLGCSSDDPGDVVAQGAMAQSPWTLESISAGGAIVRSQDPSASATLALTSTPIDGLNGWFALSGSGGCNQLSGRYRLGDGEAFSVAPLDVTERACPPEIMEVELLYLMTLERASSYTLDGARLTLDGNMGTLHFRRP